MHTRLPGEWGEEIGPRRRKSRDNGLGVLRGLQTLRLQFKTKFWEERNPARTVYHPWPGPQ